MVEITESNPLSLEASEPTVKLAPQKNTLQKLRNGCRALIAGAIVTILPNVHAEDAYDSSTDPSSAIPTGKFVVGGGGPLPKQAIDIFVDSAGREYARIAVIPSASADAGIDTRVSSYFKGWENSGAKVWLAHPKDREEASSDKFLEQFNSVTGIWLGGGDQGTFMDLVLDTKLEQKLYELSEQGVVIGGSSAGAAVMSRRMIRKGNPMPEMGVGLNLIRGSIVDQHHKTRDRFKRLLRAVEGTDCLGFGIDDGAVLMINGHRLTGIGGDVRIFRDKQEPYLLKSGMTKNWSDFGKSVLHSETSGGILEKKP
ncbi:hypothetical protein EXS65_04335 [Candidatus Peribacteria bacterium]|nr:hypothetical protein [Candidatus Peribacteria bacterium]